MDGDFDTDKELDVIADAPETELDLADEDAEDADEEESPEAHGFTVNDESEWA